MAASFSAEPVVATAFELETRAKENRLDGAERVFATLRTQVDELLAELGPYCRDT